MRRFLPIGISGFCLLLGFSTLTKAQDSFYRITLKDLKFVDGSLPAKPKAEVPATLPSEISPADLAPPPDENRTPYVAVGPTVEAYLDYADRSSATDVLDHTADTGLAVRAPVGADVAGTLVLPTWDSAGMVALKFTIPASSASIDRKTDFFKAKKSHYEELASRGITGATWFAYQARQAEIALEENPATRATVALPNTPDDLMDQTFSMFSGSRAVAENLQLDRTVRPDTRADEPTVALSSIDGLSVAEMDWKPLIANLKPDTDPLAAVIPADQHAIIFATFSAFLAVMDQADRTGSPILFTLETRAEDAQTRQRYEKQLRLSMTALGRALGPQVINSVAITGSDPYLRDGSDVAMLFEAKAVATLMSLLDVQRAMVQPAAEQISGDIDGVSFSALISHDRSVSSYLATIGNTVIVTNSKVQLQRLIETAHGKSPALATTPEYTFFRDRYKRGDADESAFVILTDATIRRWCSPRWRIADSRRTRAVAVLSELTCAHLDEIVRGAFTRPTALSSPLPIIDAGDLRLDGGGVSSSVYGTLGFLTPIAELDFDKVTEAEANGYKRWRDTYQQNWRNYFDPIGARLTVADGKLAVDLSVMPLIVNTDYKDIVDVARGSKIAPTAGDPHEDLLHIALAVDPKSHPMQELVGMGAQLVPELKVDPLAWMGKSVALYVDDDPIWAQVPASKDPSTFLEQHLDKLPIAVRAEVADVFKLVGFLTAAHAFVDASAPGLTTWMPVLYHGRSYVRITQNRGGGGDNDPWSKLAVYYSATADGLVITLSEDLIKRSLDREIARHPQPPDATTSPSPSTTASATPVTRPWLGEQYCMQAGRKAVDLLSPRGGGDYVNEIQACAFSNLPILNEWKHLYPDQDPVALHERLWHTHLLDPAGGQYTWNDAFQTAQSTVYGHPGDPKPGPDLSTLLGNFLSGNFGITFEHDGLRAKVEVETAK